MNYSLSLIFTGLGFFLLSLLPLEEISEKSVISGNNQVPTGLLENPDWTSCEPHAVYKAGGFMFYNNRWGGGKGCISVKREGDAITYWTTHDSNSPGNVTEAPLASIGSTWHGWADNKSLPRKLKDIEEIRMNWKVSLPPFEEGRRFVVYLQFYLNDTGDDARPNGDIGMIFYREGFEFEQWGKNEGDHQIDELTWTFVDKPTGGFGKYIMLAPNPAIKLNNNVLEIKNFDIAPLLKFMVKQGYYPEDKYLVHLSTSMESIIIKGTIKHHLQEFKLVARNEKEPIYTPYWIGEEKFRD